MRCLYGLKSGGILELVNQYILSPQLDNYGLVNDTAHSIARIYFSYR